MVKKSETELGKRLTTIEHSGKHKFAPPNLQCHNLSNECLHPWVKVDQASRPLPPNSLSIMVSLKSRGGDTLIKVGTDVWAQALGFSGVNFCPGIRFREVKIVRAIFDKKCVIFDKRVKKVIYVIISKVKRPVLCHCFGIKPSLTDCAVKAGKYFYHSSDVRHSGTNFAVSDTKKKCFSSRKFPSCFDMPIVTRVTFTTNTVNSLPSLKAFLLRSLSAQRPIEKGAHVKLMFAR